MALPTTRAELRQYCREYCGAPVITINVDDLQIDHAIDNAVELFHEYHAEGTQRTYIAHQVTAADIANKYITLDDNVISVTRILSRGNVGGGFSGDAMFSPIYQLRLSDVFNFSSASMTYYTVVRQHLAALDDILNVETKFDYNRYENLLKLHLDWDRHITEDSYIVAEAHIINDETLTNGKIYSNRIIRNLAGAYTKKIWGSNLSKFGGIQLLGGVTLDGAGIMSEAREDIQKYEDEISRNFGPDALFYG